MAILHPFRALRPRPDLAERVACVPYDVVSTEEAAALADGNPLSFLHVVRPEIDLPDGTDEHADAVYARGAANLRDYAAGEASVEDDAPGLFVYRLVMDGRSQTGVYGCVAVSDYDGGVILKHEKTRPAKEDDRTRHIVEQRAHAEPVMLTFRPTESVRSHVAAACEEEPLYDFTAPDGVRHTLWRVGDPAALAQAFEAVQHLYVADGHHRCKAASRAAEEVGAGPDDEAAYFPAALFPMDEMAILPYNRIVRRLPDGPAVFLERLEGVCTVEPAEDPVPTRRGDVCLYLQGRWYRFELPDVQDGGVADTLDAARLGRFVLAPLLGIEDVRTDPNIDFVGGIRGTDALERVVDEGRAEAAFSMYPTSIEELVDVSDASELMPPKSTWFEPKLRSGLLVHRFEPGA